MAPLAAAPRHCRLRKVDGGAALGDELPLTHIGALVPLSPGRLLQVPFIVDELLQFLLLRAIHRWVDWRESILKQLSGLSRAEWGKSILAGLTLATTVTRHPMSMRGRERMRKE